jgi:hypothetical protein
MAAGALMAAAGAVLGIFGGYVAKQGWDAFTTEKAPANISLQSVTSFHVKVSEGVYRVGVILKLFNMSERPYLLSSIRYGVAEVRGRGPSFHYKQQPIGRDPATVPIQNNYLKGGAEGEFKLLLPLTLFSDDMQPPGPLVVFSGPWTFYASGKEVSATPQFIGTYEGILSKTEWDRLGTGITAVNLASVDYRPPPTPSSHPPRFLLLFNPDRSAQIDSLGIEHTQIVTAEPGAMTFVITRSPLPAGTGWQVLGSTYAEVWDDPQKRALYNSIYPPAPDGEPRPFGVFAGAEDQMFGK